MQEIRRIEYNFVIIQPYLKKHFNNIKPLPAFKETFLSAKEFCSAGLLEFSNLGGSFRNLFILTVVKTEFFFS